MSILRNGSILSARNLKGLHHMELAEVEEEEEEKN
jgi:hypothetical protein